MQHRSRRRIVLPDGFILLGSAAQSAYKFNPSDVHKLEERSGVPAEDLGLEELETLIDELGIEKGSISDEDRTALAAETQTAPLDPDSLNDRENTN